jgi:predicted O-methyltransferase YrrM
MVTDYLRNFLQSKPNIGELSSNERALVSLIQKSVEALDDTPIIDRLSALKLRQDTIVVSDFGAGSKMHNDAKRKIATMAKYASIQPKHGHLFSNIISHFNLSLAIELGTSFGIGTSYLAASAKKVVTMEGCPNIANIAQETFTILGTQNIELQIGEFSVLLDKLEILEKDPIFVYIDGNHAKEPTLQYFEYFRKRLPANSILVFDDIYWSKEMKAAWRKIQSEPFFSIDLYRVGIVLLKKREAPLALSLRY